MVGKAVSHYRIIEKLGSGGIGSCDAPNRRLIDTPWRFRSERGWGRASLPGGLPSFKLRRMNQRGHVSVCSRFRREAFPKHLAAGPERIDRRNGV